MQKAFTTDPEATAAQADAFVAAEDQPLVRSNAKEGNANSNG